MPNSANNNPQDVLNSTNNNPRDVLKELIDGPSRDIIVFQFLDGPHDSRCSHI